MRKKCSRRKALNSKLNKQKSNKKSRKWKKWKNKRDHKLEREIVRKSGFLSNKLLGNNKNNPKDYQSRKNHRNCKSNNWQNRTKNYCLMIYYWSSL